MIYSYVKTTRPHKQFPTCLASNQACKQASKQAHKHMGEKEEHLVRETPALPYSPQCALARRRCFCSWMKLNAPAGLSASRIDNASFNPLISASRFALRSAYGTT